MIRLFGRKKVLESFGEANGRDIDSDFARPKARTVHDPYLDHAWISIVIETLCRNIARARFEVKKDGRTADGSPASRLFRAPNGSLSGFELWMETCAWWSLEGEAFWWFGKDYTFGVPKELHVLNPRRMLHEVADGRVVRWLYTGDDEYEPFTMTGDEVIHFRQWNPLNRWRGICPLATLGTEIEQDVAAGRQNTALLEEGGIPKGLLKSDQLITEPEADQLERRWERKYGTTASRKVAVLGKGTEYQQLTFSPDVLQLYEMKKWNLYTILAKYGIPPRVANIMDSKSSLSGSDTKEQHAAFWKYTLIPLLQEFEQVTEIQFFRRLGLEERGTFNLNAIPELQESEDAQSSRDIAEINAGLKTINDVLRERGLPTKPWGDVWYRPSKLITTGN